MALTKVGYVDEVTTITAKNLNEIQDEVIRIGDALIKATPQAYGAKGDGTTIDTMAFQDALAENRVVVVPGGTYVLSDTLVIRENCCLELSQDTVLQFAQTSGNCIEMRGSAVLRGNHAVISAAYGLTGNVISMDTLLDGKNHASIPPYAKADPQWKRQRFVYDVNIVKPNSAGFNRPLDDGKCNGTAIYISATNVSNDSTDIAFMWGVTISGIRIAGGFSYGIHAINYDSADGSTGHYADDAWNHDMRIEAVIEGCEIGVALENCNGAHLNVTVQPNTTGGGTKYAKQGVCLKDSRFVDMMRSRVWDWHYARNDSAEYKHIALYGNCRGLLLDDFLVTEHPDTDIRDDIYTDTPSNFDTMTILQEPANKWFKSVDGVPYFNDGTANRKLMLAVEKITAEQAEFIHPADGYYTYEDNFDNLVDGYTDGTYILANGNTSAASGYTTTDFIPVDGANTHTYRIGGEGISWADSSGYCRIAWYDANKTLKGTPMSWDKIGSSIYYPTIVEDGNAAFAFATNANVAPPNGAAYFRITAKGSGANLAVTIDDPLDYIAVWHGKPKRLDDSIKVKAENVVGLEGGTGGGVQSDWNAAEGEPGHVLNRTHYTEGTGEVLYDGTFMQKRVGQLTMLSNGVANIAFGKVYTVTYDGVSYVCTPFADGYGDPSLGAPIISGGYDWTNYPFFINTYDDDGLQTVAGGATSGDHTLKVVDGAVHPLDEKFIPDTIARKEDIPSGGGVTSWNDLGESDNAVLLPETQFAIDESMGIFVTDGNIDFVVGKTYTVNWNGVEYTTVAVDGNFDGMPLVAVGNPVAFGGENNNLPFAAACLMGIIGAIPLDGSTSATVSIKGHKLEPIPTEYLNNALPYCVRIVDETCTATVAEMEKAYHSGRMITLEAGEENGELCMIVIYYLAARHRLETTGDYQYGAVYTFSALSSSTSDYILVPCADGTYTVRVS